MIKRWDSKELNADTSFHIKDLSIGILEPSPLWMLREDICDISKNFSLKLDSKNDFIHFYNPYTFLLVCEIFLERMEALDLWEVT